MLEELLKCTRVIQERGPYIVLSKNIKLSSPLSDLNENVTKTQKIPLGSFIGTTLMMQKHFDNFDIGTFEKQSPPNILFQEQFF